MKKFIATFAEEAEGALKAVEVEAETLEEALDKFKAAHPDGVLTALIDTSHGSFIKRIETDMKAFLSDPAAAVKGLFGKSAE